MRIWTIWHLKQHFKIITSFSLCSKMCRMKMSCQAWGHTDTEVLKTSHLNHKQATLNSRRETGESASLWRHSLTSARSKWSLVLFSPHSILVLLSSLTDSSCAGSVTLSCWKLLFMRRFQIHFGSLLGLCFLLEDADEKKKKSQPSVSEVRLLYLLLVEKEVVQRWWVVTHWFRGDQWM